MDFQNVTPPATSPPGGCREAIISNDYADIIVDREVGGINYERIRDLYCGISLSNFYELLYIKRSTIPVLNLKNYNYSAIPVCYGLTDTLSLENSGILRVQNPEGLDLTGKNVLIGIIDTGECVK